MSTPLQMIERQVAAVQSAVCQIGVSAKPADLVQLACELGRMISALEAARARLLDGAEEANARSDVGHRISVIDHLHATNALTRRQARADVRSAAESVSRFPQVLDAWSDGRLSSAQARAIMLGLRNLTPEYCGEQLERCQTELIGFAASFDPDELRVLANRMVEVIDPERADQLAADRVAAQARLAFARRYLVIHPDHHGSMLIRGQLPLADGELLLTQLDSLTPSFSSYRDGGDLPAPSTRRADALVRLCSQVAAQATLPANGGDRPTLLVTVPLDALQRGLASAHLVASGEPIGASEARRLACDANLIPTVLGSASEPLDVGRTHRLFSGRLRAALVARDEGCAFPGCDTSPPACEGHHIVPWWQDGPTALSNGVLLCPHHHRMVEPDPQLDRELQWIIQLDDVGLPTFTPPSQIDPRRRPRQHHRYRLRVGRVAELVQADAA